MPRQSTEGWDVTAIIVAIISLVGTVAVAIISTRASYVATSAKEEVGQAGSQMSKLLGDIGQLNQTVGERRGELTALTRELEKLRLDYQALSGADSATLARQVAEIQKLLATNSQAPAFAELANTVKDLTNNITTDSEAIYIGHTKICWGHIANAERFGDKNKSQEYVLRRVKKTFPGSKPFIEEPMINSSIHLPINYGNPNWIEIRREDRTLTELNALLYLTNPGAVGVPTGKTLPDVMYDMKVEYDYVAIGRWR